jgi:acyl-CoA synthetase (AMP-forming)/AMP-acid ligase II
LESSISKLITDVGATGFLVLEAHEGKGKWNGMQTWKDAMTNYKGTSQSILTNDPGVVPEDGASILFTSGTSLANPARFPYYYCSLSHASSTGTTGLPKGVLSTQRQWLTNAANVR